MSLLANIQRLLGRGASRSAPAIAVAGFGKHPGWDDHIDDIGMSTDALVTFKRWLYVEGIRRNIDADAWEKLEPTNRIDGFKHLFIWRTGDEVIVGRMWSSRDGKGRTRYPMVVCAHCRGVSMDWVLAEAADELQRLEAQCKATESASTVRSLIAATQQKLESRAATAQAGAVMPQPGRSLSIIADRLSTQNDSQALYRLLYQVERELSSLRRRDSGTTTERAARSQHMRVPACEESPGKAAGLWLSLIADQLGRSTPVLVLVPTDERWVDVIVGVPTDAQLHCVRAGGAAIPLVTDVPYTLDAAFISRADQLVQSSRDGSFTPATAMPAAPNSPGNRSRMPVLLATLFIVAALGLGGLYFVMFVSEPSSAPAQDQTAAETQTPPQIQPSPSLASAAGSPDFDVKVENWAFALTAGSPRFERLRELVASSPPLESIAREMNIAASSVRPDRELVASVEQKFQDWLKINDELAERFEESQWRDAADALRQGMSPVSELVRAPQRVSTSRGDGFLQRLEKAIPVAAQAADIQQQLDRLSRAEQTVIAGAAGDSILESIGDLRDQMIDDGDLSSLHGAVTLLADRTEELAAVVTSRWPEVDVEFFIANSQVHAQDRQEAEGGWQVYANWMAEVRRPMFDRLDLAADPRRDPILAEQMQRIGRYMNQIEDAQLQVELPADALERTAQLEQSFRELNEQLEWNRTNQRVIAASVQEIREELQHWDSTLDRLVHGSIENIRQFRAALQDRSISVRSAVLADRWRAQRDHLLDSTDEDAPVREQAELIESFLRELDRQLADPRAAFSGQPYGNVDVESIRENAVKRREQIFAETFEALESVEAVPHTDDRTFWDTWQDRREKFEAWVAASQRLVADYSDIEGLLDLGYGLDEQPAQGENTIREIHDAWTQQAVFAEHQASVERITNRVAALRSIEDALVRDASERRELLSRLASLPADPELVLAGWRKLAGGLEDPAALLQEQQMHERLTAVVNVMRQGHAQRRTDLLDEIRTERAQRWQQHVRMADDPDVIDRALELRTAFGVRDDQLDAVTRVNIALHDLRQRLDALDRSEHRAELPEAITQFSSIVSRELPALADHAADASTLLSSMNELLEGLGSPAVDFAQVGPGVLGWRSEVLNDGAVVTYHPPANASYPHPISFRRVGEETYLGVQEVPLGLFVDVVALRGDWDSVRAMTINTHRGEDDLRRGPRVWELRVGEMVSAARWPAGVSTADTPGLEHPVQYISPAAAIYAARLLNCRLPSTSEWRAAVAASEAEANIANANLRDQSWKAQFDYVTERIARERLSLPNEGVFTRETSSTVDPGDTWMDELGQAHDDSVVWFATVDPGGNGNPSAFHHLIGNVAEFVFDKPEVIVDRLAQTPVPSGEVISELLAEEHVRVEQGPTLFVIGGSALSPPSLALDEPYAVPVEGWFDFRLRGYSDVGFRLAFNASGMPGAQRGIGDRLAQLLADQPYFTAGGN